MSSPTLLGPEQGLGSYRLVNREILATLVNLNGSIHWFGALQGQCSQREQPPTTVPSTVEAVETRRAPKCPLPLRTIFLI